MVLALLVRSIVQVCEDSEHGGDWRTGQHCQEYGHRH